MSKSVPYADFDLISVATDGKKLQVVYFDKQKPNIEQHPKGFDVPHPDLIEALKAITGQEIAATALCLLDGWIHSRDHIKANDEALNTARRRYNEEILRIEVIGVKFTGEEESEGLQFKVKLDCDGAKVPLETPQYVFIEADEEQADRGKAYKEALKKEVWSYLYKDKKSQQSLKLDEPANPDESEEGKQKPKGGLNVA